LSVHAEGPAPESFLSGRVGYVGRRRAPALRLADGLLDLGLRLRGVSRRLDALAAELPARRVLVLCAYRPESARAVAAAAELRATRHEVRLAFGSTGEPRPELAEVTVTSGLRGGKFQNLNATLEATGRGAEDWTLVIDDDVLLPTRFLDRMLAVCEGFRLQLAQPALSLASHGAWTVTRRRARSLARETRFVEIGPVTLLARKAAGELVPFPDLRFGWGLDLHWAALAGRRGWRLGVVDALPVRHDLAGVASGYPHAEAVAEAQGFLAARTFLPASDANVTVRELR
jgi:hypothetical protein